jgi:hypothetical protein
MILFAPPVEAWGSRAERDSREPERTVRTLDEILDLLNQRHQRATYGAVAGLLNQPATFLMQGRPRDFRHSWVVNQETDLPTGYSAEEIHPSLKEHRQIISSSAQLRAWLEHPE